ncbi:MAG: ATP-dependent sacrificial sulfur transferase LarE [Thermodesulfobacteriota bacterium]
MEGKLQRLKKIISDLESVIVAFSGGVDSTFLLQVAYDVLGGNSIALTAVSPSYPAFELQEARELAKNIGVRHIMENSHELDIPEYAENSLRRCFFCKTELFDICFAKANELGIKNVIYGATLSDLGDFRPGMDAAKEMGVRAPLLEAGLTKEEIRDLSRRIGLSTWDKPQMACLSSRIPYGVKVTEDKLRAIALSELILRQLGLRQFRVRYHEKIARIEIDESEFEKLLSRNLREIISKRLKELGFTYVTIDIEGYRSGSMNQLLVK